MVVLTFWALLALPGYALTHRYSRALLRSGLLGAVALSYTWALGAFALFCVPAYALQLPLWTGSLCWLVMVLAGAWYAWRHLRKDRLTRALFAGSGAELAVILADVFLAFRVGGFMGGDTRFHSARVRMLLDHGFNNWEPYFSDHPLTHAYHTNVYHALLAVCAEVMSADYLVVWFGTLPWAHLMTTAGVYFLAWCFTRRRRLSNLAAIVWILGNLYSPTTLYPNQLVMWTVAVALGLTCLLAGRRRTASILGLLALTTVLTAQLHTLYAFFLLLGLTPALLLAAAYHWRRPRRAAVYLAAIGALGLCVPYLAISKFADSDVVAQQDAAKDASSAHVPKRKQENLFPERMQRLADGKIVGTLPNLSFTSLLFIGLPWAITLATRARQRAWPALVAAALFYVVYGIPTLCTWAADAIGGAWVLHRADRIPSIIHVALWPMLALWFPWRRWSRASSFVAVAATVLALCLSRPSTLKAWRDYANLGFRTKMTRGVAEGVQRRGEAWRRVRYNQTLRAGLTPLVESGQTVFADLVDSRDLVMLLDVYVISADRTGPLVLGKAQRDRDFDLLTAKSTSNQQRAAILTRYGVRQAVVNKGTWQRYRWLKAWAKGPPAAAGSMRVFTFDPEKVAAARELPPKHP